MDHEEQKQQQKQKQKKKKKKEDEEKKENSLRKSVKRSPAGEISIGHSRSIHGGIKGDGEYRIHLGTSWQSTVVSRQTLHQLMNCCLGHSISNHSSGSLKGSIGTSQVQHTTTGYFFILGLLFFVIDHRALSLAFDLSG